MGQLFAWSMVSSLTLACMYLVYKWMLAGENQHSFNRAILLMIYVVSLVAPLMLHFDFSAPHKAAPEVGNIMVGIAASPVAATPSAIGPLLLNMLLIIYLIGIGGVSLSTVVVILRLMHLISSGERRLLPGGKILVLTSDINVAPFSWRRYVVMSHADWEEAGEVIVLHEMRHLSARHWIDLFIAQAVVAFQWYNPVAWLMREELKAVHEYQADLAVMASGSDIHEYQMLLIKKAVGARFPSLANSLNHSQLKKRITMMYKNRSSAGRRLRSLALVPACAAALLVACTPAAKSVIDDASEATLDVSGNKGSEKSPETTVNIDEVAVIAVGTAAKRMITISGTDSVKSDNTDLDGYTVYIDGKKKDADAFSKLESSEIKMMKVVKSENAVYVETKNGVVESAEEMPEFPGGVEALMKYLSENIRYPSNAYEAKIEGRVVVKFIVCEDGRVRDPQIERSVSEDLDAEAIRVVKSLPAFTPGKNGGKPVAVSFRLPVNFKLQS
ncbi:MAG: M56 family metallopeptidase [Bacteroidales bacterium]|nr:M56 family metallopeptidase [Bacteroidales bacterium]